MRILLRAVFDGCALLSMAFFVVLPQYAWRQLSWRGRRSHTVPHPERDSFWNEEHMKRPVFLSRD
jgi:hypothetical protein